MATPLQYLIAYIRQEAQVNAEGNSVGTFVRRVETWLEDGGALDALRSPPLRIREMETIAKLQQRQQGDDILFDLPADHLQIREIFSDTRPLSNVQWIPFESFRAQRDNINAYVTPLLTTVGNSIMVMPVPETLEILYYARIPSLARTDAGANPTNFVFENHRHMYEDGVVAAAAYSRRIPALASPRFNSFMGAVRMANERHGPAAIAQETITGRPINAPGRNRRLRW